jgi:hypothetical protein
LLFKPKANRQELLDKLDVEMEKQTKVSTMLKERAEKSHLKALDLASEEMEEAAKSRLALSLVCKQHRNHVEARMADMENTRIQLEMAEYELAAPLIERAYSVLREAATERERINSDLTKVSFLTQLGTEKTADQVGYGIKDKTIDAEYAKLRREAGLSAEGESKESETAGKELPKVPDKAREMSSMTEKKKQAEKG